MNVPDISILDTIDDLQEKLAVKACSKSLYNNHFKCTSN